MYRIRRSYSFQLQAQDNKICVSQWILAIDSRCNCRSFSVYKYENPSSATFNNCAWIIFSQNTSNLARYLFMKAFSCFEGTIRGHKLYFVRRATSAIFVRRQFSSTFYYRGIFKHIKQSKSKFIFSIAQEN